MPPFRADFCAARRLNVHTAATTIRSTPVSVPTMAPGLPVVETSRKLCCFEEGDYYIYTLQCYRLCTVLRQALLGMSPSGCYSPSLRNASYSSWTPAHQCHYRRLLATALEWKHNNGIKKARLAVKGASLICRTLLQPYAQRRMLPVLDV